MKGQPFTKAQTLKQQIARLERYAPHKKRELFVLRSMLVSIENKSFSQKIQTFRSRGGRGVVARSENGLVVPRPHPHGRTGDDKPRTPYLRIGQKNLTPSPSHSHTPSESLSIFSARLSRVGGANK